MADGLCVVTQDENIINSIKKTSLTLGKSVFFHSSYEEFEASPDIENVRYWPIWAEATILNRQESLPPFKFIALHKAWEKLLHIRLILKGVTTHCLAETAMTSSTLSIAWSGELSIKDELARYGFINELHFRNYLKLKNGRAILDKLFLLSREKFDEDIPLLKAATQSRDSKTARSLAHRLKSTFGNAGFYRISVLFHWIEMAAEEEQMTIASQCTSILENLFDDSIDYWQDFMESNDQ